MVQKNFFLKEEPLRRIKHLFLLFDNRRIQEEGQ